MLFSSLTFLFVYFPIVLILYYLVKSRTKRNIVLLIFSLLFYSWGEPKLVCLMLLEVFVTFILVLKMSNTCDQQKKKKYLILVIIFIITFLFLFKYYNFFIVRILKLNSFALSISLPIGISFYSFQIISYAVDVYREQVKVQKNVLDLTLYVSFFPQLIAGPIVRYSTIAKELKERKENANDFAYGLRRFIIGLSKKVIISNQMAIVSDKVFLSADIASFSSGMYWLAAISFMFQIYFDFSGYSDMAIGLGRMFGFHFLENFNYPYISTSITDFWRRWHMSLSSWFRDYVYIPLGGNRVSKFRWLMNILIVWCLTGLWHGASFNFVLWGLYYGILLIVEKLFLGRVLKKLPGLNWIIVMLLVLFGWVLFNAPSGETALFMIKKMLTGFEGINRSTLNNLNILYLWEYYVIALIGCFPICKKIGVKIFNTKYGKLICDLYLLVIFFLCVMFLVNNSYNPFIYFKF